MPNPSNKSRKSFADTFQEEQLSHPAVSNQLGGEGDAASQSRAQLEALLAEARRLRKQPGNLGEPADFSSVKVLRETMDELKIITTREKLTYPSYLVHAILNDFIRRWQEAKRE